MPSELATYGLDDPEVEGVACHFTVPERGGVKGWLGVAEEIRHFTGGRQIGPIRFKVSFRTGRRRVPEAPFTILQEDANCPWL